MPEKRTYIAARDRRTAWCGALSINDVDLYPAGKVHLKGDDGEEI